jgi:hypothetical protein
MSAILLAVTGLDASSWEARFRALAPRRDIRLWPESLGDPAANARGAPRDECDPCQEQVWTEDIHVIHWERHTSAL